MSDLGAVLAANSCVALLLALAAVCAGRLLRRPALAHALWLLVLVKLVTPPFFRLPITTVSLGETVVHSTELPRFPVEEAAFPLEPAVAPSTEPAPPAEPTLPELRVTRTGKRSQIAEVRADLEDHRDTVVEILDRVSTLDTTLGRLIDPKRAPEPEEVEEPAVPERPMFDKAQEYYRRAATEKASAADRAALERAAWALRRLGHASDAKRVERIGREIGKELRYRVPYNDLVALANRESRIISEKRLAALLAAAGAAKTTSLPGKSNWPGNSDRLRKLEAEIRTRGELVKQLKAELSEVKRTRSKRGATSR